MIDIPHTKYIILFWIIALILFTFYCLFRLWYRGSSARMDKFFNTSVSTTAPNIIQYVDNIISQDKITDIESCSNVYDDNYGVRALGYRNCNAAYSDYLIKNLDTSKTYGATKSVADYCPVITKSPEYMKCMATLLEKYNSNANMLQGVSNDMSALVNKRIQDRSDVINDIQISINPYINDKKIRDFELNSELLGNLNKTNDDKLYDASRYFQNKYSSSYSVFANIPTNLNNANDMIEGFTSLSITVDPYIVNTFFGQYSPIKGQYLAFNNLQVSLDFMKATATTTEPQIDTSMPTLKPDTNDDELSNVGKVSLVITDANTNGQIIYDVGSASNYNNTKNAIILNIIGQTINNVNTNDNQNLQQLLVLLGITVPNKIIIMLEETKSDSGVKRWTYKLMNLNMDTIMVLKKINNLR
jgi:hypothetical protein